MRDVEETTTHAPPGRRRWLGPVLEAMVAFAVAAIFLGLCLSIRIDPMQRVGQISGLASLQLRFLLVALPLIAALIATAKMRGGSWFPMTSRLACAALAGLATAFVAGGIIVALRGTPFCLNAIAGDSDTLATWANAIKAHYRPLYPPPYYPPLFPHALRWYMEAVDLPAFYALKHLQILVTALTGPLAYLSWRLLLRPGWALGIGVVAALIIVEPYKPYENLVLIVFVPVMIRFLQTIRRVGDRSIHELAKAGVVFGAAFGVMFLTYSGWFRWSAPGVIGAALCVFPWRTARGRATLFGAIALVMFVVVIWGYLSNIFGYARAEHLLGIGGGPIIRDDYIYFDVTVDPTYIAMWRGDLPGTVTSWPPPGELAGVGVYSLLLFVGVGIAVMLGRSRSAVIAIGLVLAGTWLQRFWYAHHMYQTKLVQLYPRTTIEIIYCLLLLSGFGIYYIVEYVARRSDPAGPLRNPSGLIGAVCALCLVIGSAGSSMADRYMPLSSMPRGPGWLAFMAHDAVRTHQSPEPPPFPNEVPTPAPPPPAPPPPLPPDATAP